MSKRELVRLIRTAILWFEKARVHFRARRAQPVFTVRNDAQAGVEIVVGCPGPLVQLV